MFAPMQSALSINIVIAIFLTIVRVPSSALAALIEEKKIFTGQERGKKEI